MQRFFVYIFVNHNTGLPVYVGKGCRKRDFQHQSNASLGHKGRLYNWMRKYQKLNNAWPIPFRIAEGMEECKALELEIGLISFFGRADLKTGCLFNLTDGGDGVSGYSFSPHLVKQISEKNTGRKLSPVSIAKRTASVLGSKRSPETIKRMSLAALNRKKRPPEKQSRGYKMSARSCANMSIAARKREEEEKINKMLLANYFQPFNSIPLIINI